MLLRRVSLHVRRQDWVSVSIDLFLVVAGVFIGIQVANWNDQRQQRLEDEVLLERLGDDFTGLVAQAANLVPRISRQPDLTSRLIDALRIEKDLTLDEETETWISASMEIWASFPIPPSYEEAVNSGMLSRIADAELKDAIFNYARSAVTDRKISAQQFSLFSTGVIDAPVRLSTKSLREFDGKFDVEYVDWEEMKRTLPHLQALLRLQVLRALWAESAGGNARETLRLIRQNLSSKT